MKDQRSIVSGRGGHAHAAPSKQSILNHLKKLDYKSLLHIIREVEEQINDYSEVYTKMIELGKSSMKVDMEFKEVLRNAE